MQNLYIYAIYIHIFRKIIKLNKCFLFVKGQKLDCYMVQQLC